MCERFLCVCFQGTVSAFQGSNILTTTTDITGLFNCGDWIQIGSTPDLYRTSVDLCALNNATAIFLDRTYRYGKRVTSIPFVF